MIRAARRGDSAAWRRIDERFRSVLALLMRGQIGPRYRSRLDTDDVVQSTFLSAYKELESFDDQGPGSFHAWLVRILRNRISSRRSNHDAAKREVGRERPPDEHMLDRRSRPGEQLEHEEEAAFLLQTIGALPTAGREIYVMRCVDGLSFAAIAEKRGSSESTARRDYREMVLTVRSRMQDDGS
ncbi:MAG: sigma-70 family RNA polymerase sigma factor [bacterium]|nr:sigma-70 family RNA polymerase sigma factor [bacterium]